MPYGHSVDVAGHGIPGGLIYVGTHLEGVMGQTEPALINPQLPVAPAGPAWGEAHSRAYHLLSPAARAAYLGWHAGGRRAEAPAGMVLLFCSGLERRVLQDRGEDPAATGELPAGVDVEIKLQ